MGRQYGEALRAEIQALAEERLRLARRDAEQRGRRPTRAQCLDAAARCLPAHAAYDPEGFAEFQGIAEGAGIAPELLLIGNGYTDYKDLLGLGRTDEECTAFWVRPEAAGGRTLCGQTWDMHATAEPFAVLVHRRPARGPETLSLTVAGCLSLIGLNSAGVAVGNTNLTATDARPGVIYVALIHRALRSRSLPAAVAAFTEAPRAAGHNYYLADASGQVSDVETTAGRAVVLSPEGDGYVHTNHYTAPELLPLAVPPDPESTTRERHARMSALLSEAPRPLTPEGIRQLLADHAGGERAICVHNTTPDGGKSCAVVVMCPQTRELWVRVGTPCGGPLHRVALDDVAA